MTNQHPITPPPELVQQWVDTLAWSKDQVVFTRAAQWGADKELEACCEWLERDWNDNPDCVQEIRAARRPNPPTLKEQALAILDDCSDRLDGAHENIIRQALEQLK